MLMKANTKYSMTKISTPDMELSRSSVDRLLNILHKFCIL